MAAELLALKAWWLQKLDDGLPMKIKRVRRSTEMIKARCGLSLLWLFRLRQE